MVQIDKPLQKKMNNPEAGGRLVLWAIELDEFNVLYHPRTAIKAQALADFVAEFTVKEDEDEGPTLWIIRTDGLSNQRVGGVGVVLHSPKRDFIEYGVRLQFPKTNNEAKYEAILTSHDLAKAVGVLLVVIHSDSQVIINDYEAKGEWIKEYLSMIKERVS